MGPNIRLPIAFASVVGGLLPSYAFRGQCQPTSVFRNAHPISLIRKYYPVDPRHVDTTTTTATLHKSIHFASVFSDASASVDSFANNEDTLSAAVDALNAVLDSSDCPIRDIKVRAALLPTSCRIGLVATKDIGADENFLSVPLSTCGSPRDVFDPKISPSLAPVLPEKYDGWTGDAGLLAMLLLKETLLPRNELWAAWIQCLPTIDEATDTLPMLWDELAQEVLQSSSTKKIYRILDDADEDTTWLEENIWSADRVSFPASTERLRGSNPHPLFSLDGFRWALAIVNSRAVFIDGTLMLAPVADFANHADFVGGEGSGQPAEAALGYTGTFGITKAVRLATGKGRGSKLRAGDQAVISYGPKSAAEYLLDHGFVPPSASISSVSELTFEIDESDRFGDDKIDVLEFETYGGAMDPMQSFDVYGGPGSMGNPDPAMLQFLRLQKLNNKDAFLLESVFRKEVWGFMADPVSEENEADVVDAILDACETALEDMNSVPSSDTVFSDRRLNDCATVRDAERRALSMLSEYMTREKEALDLKEYYQQRRLKSLGLDSNWEDENSPDVGWGPGRNPGGAESDFF